MSLLNARAYKISGGRITLSHIPTISRGVRTQSNHVTTLTVSILWPELKMPGKHSYSPKSRTKVARGDQQRDYLRRYNGISEALRAQQRLLQAPQSVQKPAKTKTRPLTLQTAANGS